MLGSASVVAFVPSRNPKKARSFYESVLGLHFLAEDQFAHVFDANGVMSLSTNVVDSSKPQQFYLLRTQP